MMICKLEVPVAGLIDHRDDGPGLARLHAGATGRPPVVRVGPCLRAVTGGFRRVPSSAFRAAEEGDPTGMI